MPRIFGVIGDELNQRFKRKDPASGNEFVGFQSNGAVVLRDRRGTPRIEIPNVSAKAETLGDDPLAIYKPSGAKRIDAAKAEYLVRDDLNRPAGDVFQAIARRDI